jgi:uncharacterized membrane protein YhhN
MLSKHRFLVWYLLVVLLEIWGEITETRWLIYVFKPLIMISLGAMAWLLASQQTKPKTPWLLAGIGFALLGDSLLMIREANWFVFGLGAFLLMQLCYILAFGTITHPKATLTSLLPFAIYFASFMAILYKPASALNLLVPVVIYGVSICVMGYAAALRKHTAPPLSYTWVLAGALLFVLSDSVLAINRFVQPLAGASLLIMSTYAAAQYLIVLGFFKSL